MLPQLKGEILLSLKWKRPEAEGQHFSGSRQRSQALSPREPKSGRRGAGQALRLRGQGQNQISLLEIPAALGARDCGAWETGEEEGEGEAWTRPAAAVKRNGPIGGSFRMQNGQDSVAGGL